MALGTHTRVDQDLCHGIARRRRLFLFISVCEVLDEVDRVVVRDVLQSVRHALDEIVLLDDCHDRLWKKKTGLAYPTAYKSLRRRTRGVAVRITSYARAHGILDRWNPIQENDLLS